MTYKRISKLLCKTLSVNVYTQGAFAIFAGLSSQIGRKVILTNVYPNAIPASSSSYKLPCVKSYVLFTESIILAESFHDLLAIRKQ